MSITIGVSYLGWIFRHRRLPKKRRRLSFLAAPDLRHLFDGGDGGQRGAFWECRFSNGRYTRGDDDGNKIRAFEECDFANLGHGGGDGVSLCFYVRTAENQGGFTLVKQHAVFVGGIVGVILSHGDRCGAIPKSTITYSFPPLREIWIEAGASDYTRLDSCLSCLSHQIW